MTHSGQHPDTIRVWDLPVRIFHWLILVLVTLLWYTGEVGGLDLSIPWPGGETLFWGNMDVHMLLGQAVLTLVIFRVLWGLFGSTTARFASFVRGPRVVLQYARASLSGREPPTLGHNPAGTLMVLLLLGLLAAQALLGLFASDDIFSEGPLAHLVSSDTSGRLTELHGLLFNLLLAAIALHVLAAFVYLLRGKNLIKAMVTGHKPAAQLPQDEARDLRFVSSAWALLLLVVSGLLVWSLRLL